MKTEEGNQRANTSIWELTVSERMNASTIIRLTTARPFVYCRNFFKCFYCHEDYLDIKKLLEHTTSHQIPDQAKILNELLKKGKRTLKVDISELKCRMCQQEFEDLDVIRKHLVTEHSVTFTESKNGVVVYNISTKSELFFCHICKKKFPTFILLNRHMNVHFNTSVCEICGAGFMSHHRLIQHKEIHQPGGYSCNRCSKVYTTKGNLKYHILEAHEGSKKIRTLRCSHCPERFTEHFRKLKHLKDSHGISFTFECDQCKSVFPTRRALTSHTNKIHSLKTQCELCKKCFSSITALKDHMFSHSGEKNHVCGTCQKSYSLKRSLNQHMKSHVKGNQLTKFSCPGCSNVFFSRNDFTKHVKKWHPNSYFDYMYSVETN